jgi:phage terminase large subunit-like protein
MVFPAEDRVLVMPRFWITRKAIQRRHRRMLDKFLQWEADGYLTVFDSDVHDYDAIRQQILDDIEKYRITDIGFDQFQAPAIVSAIESRTSVTCEKVPQTTTRMNAGSKELTRLLGNRAFTTSGNPIMRWNAGAATYKMDSDRHIKPDKASSTDSIDGITALVNALTVLVQSEGETEVGLFVMDDEED